VREVTPEVLARTRRYVPRLRRRRMDTPLLLDPLYIERAADVFPIELLDLSERHRLLWGQ